MDIEDLQKNKEVSEVSGSSKIDRNDLLPRDLVPEKILPFLTTFIYELFQSLYLEKDLLEWSHQQFRRFCEKSVIVFRRLHHIQPSHSQISYVYRQLLAQDNYKGIDCSVHQHAPSLQHYQFLTENFEEWCLKKHSRCSSGVSVFSLMTSPHPRYQDSNGKWKTQRYSCKHNCYYCPNEPAHKDNGWQPQARSYLYQEPTVLRANRQKFSPSQQIWERGQVYLMNGHPVDKMEIIILGGTWSEYPRDYQEWFLGQVYWAANHLIEWCRLKSQGKDLKLPEETEDPEKNEDDKDRGNIEYQEPHDDRVTTLPKYRGILKEQEANEKAICRVVGITIETRPDAISVQTLYDARKWGVTRIQIGVQHTHQPILDLLNRGCTLKDTTESTSLMMDLGFKIVYHWMPDLPGSSPELDKEMFRRILLPQKVETDGKSGSGSGTGSGSGSGPNLVWDLWADEWKIYPFSVLPWSVCENWEKEGKYKSYGTDRLIDVLMYCKRLMARPDINASSLRIVRLIRDIPVPYIIAGNKVAHLRDVIKEKLHQKGEYCVCIRCREIRMERPQLSSARWRMIVKRVKTGGDRGWDSLGKNLADSPMDQPPNTFSTPNTMKSSILVLWGVIYGFLWSLADIFWTILYPYHQGQWWWGQTFKINPKGHNNYIQDLPLSWQKIPENYHSLQQSGNAYNCFLSLEGGRHQHDTPIYGFIRFHLTPNAGRRVFSALQGCVLVRELHVYGKSTGVVSWETKNKESNPHSQHRGIGSTLLSMAEYHARKKGFRGVAIISGVGVRDYYRKRGYSLIDHYMIKYF